MSRARAGAGRNSKNAAARVESDAGAPRKNKPCAAGDLRLDPDLVLTANLWVQFALTAILWVQQANYPLTAPLKTKAVLTPLGQLMGPIAADLWV